MTYRKVGTGGPGRAQGRTFPRGRRQAEADVAGVVLGWSGGKDQQEWLSLQPPRKTPHFPRHMGATSRPWEALGSFWREEE